MSTGDSGPRHADLFVPVVGGRISDAITEQIRTAILDRRLQPGDRLPNERDLAARFGVNRVVGEGISHMLVLSEVEPDEIAEARLIVELGTVTLAAERATDEDLAELRSRCAAAEDALAAGEYAPRLSRDFHAALARAAHNRAVEMVSATFAGPLSMLPVREREQAERSHRRSVEEHVELVEAIAGRDAERARRIMCAQLTRGTDVDTDALPS